MIPERFERASHDEMAIEKIRSDEKLKRRIFKKYGNDPDIKEWFRLYDVLLGEVFRLSKDGILSITDPMEMHISVSDMRKLRGSMVDAQPIEIARRVKKPKPKNCARCGAWCASSREAIVHCRPTMAQKWDAKLKRLGIRKEG